MSGNSASTLYNVDKDQGFGVSVGSFLLSSVRAKVERLAAPGQGSVLSRTVTGTVMLDSRTRALAQIDVTSGVVVSRPAVLTYNPQGTRDFGWWQ